MIDNQHVGSPTEQAMAEQLRLRLDASDMTQAAFAHRVGVSVAVVAT